MPRHTPRLLSLGLLLAPLAAPAAPAPSPRAGAPAGLKDLQGTWRGYVVAPDGTVDTYAVSEVTFVVKGDAFRLEYATVLEPSVVVHTNYRGTLKLGPAAKAWPVDLSLTEAEGKRVKGKALMRGIFHSDGKTLRLCLSEVGGKARPRKFAACEEEDIFLFRLRRQGP